MNEFAPAVAALIDHEEMVLALVHPLFQVYTLPRTGQLAYVGHMCICWQCVTTFLASLPLMPSRIRVNKTITLECALLGSFWPGLRR